MPPEDRALGGVRRRLLASYVGIADGLATLANTVSDAQRRSAAARCRCIYLSTAPSVGRDRRAARRLGLSRAGASGDHREAVRRRSASARALNETLLTSLRRAADLPDRPLPRQGGGPEHPRAAVRERAVRAGLEPQPHRPRPDHRRRGHRHRGGGLYDRARALRDMVVTTSSRCSASSPWSPRPTSSRRGWRPRRSRCSLRSPPPEPSDGARPVRPRGTAASRGYLRGGVPEIRRPRPTPPCGSGGELALGRRAVLPADRQAARAQGDRDRCPDPAGAAPRLRVRRARSAAAEPTDPDHPARRGRIAVALPRPGLPHADAAP